MPPWAPKLLAASKGGAGKCVQTLLYQCKVALLVIMGDPMEMVARRAVRAPGVRMTVITLTPSKKNLWDRLQVAPGATTRLRGPNCKESPVLVEPYRDSARHGTCYLARLFLWHGTACIIEHVFFCGTARHGTARKKSDIYLHIYSALDRYMKQCAQHGTLC